MLFTSGSSVVEGRGGKAMDEERSDLFGIVWSGPCFGRWRNRIEAAVQDRASHTIICNLENSYFVSLIPH